MVTIKCAQRIISEIGGCVSLLDAGCGEGNYIIPLSSKFEKSNFLEIDKNSELVDFVNYYAERYRKNLKAKISILDEFDIDERFDVIICVAVLQYLKEGDDFFKKIKCSLMPGGKLIVNQPVNYNRILPDRWFSKINYDTVNNAQKQKKSIADIERLFDTLGFRVEETHVTNGFFGTLANEILFLSLDRIQQVSLVSKIFLSVFFSTLLLPVFLLFNLINYFSEKRFISGAVWILT